MLTLYFKKIYEWEKLMSNVWKTQSVILSLKMTSTGINLLSPDNVLHCILQDVCCYDNGREELGLLKTLLYRVEFTP